MLELERLRGDLDAEGLSSWASELEPLLAERIADTAHGKLREWRDALDSLPSIQRLAAELGSAAIGAPDLKLNHDQQSATRDALLRLLPWRKGPFDIGGVVIDAEWRSNLKWDRVRAAISPLKDRLVLDVGSGNGYYALRMRGQGARMVIGIDPTLLYVVQYRAIASFIEPQPVHVLPLRLHDLPPQMRAFDTVFSMGVLYHQRSPLTHLQQLRDALKPGGELVLETLVLPNEEACARTPENRYARMRNVWLLPSIAELTVWLARSGYIDITLADVTATTVDEQRSTRWMPFESLHEALDPDDPTRTVEGWPAPRRAILVARSPARSGSSSRT